MNILVAGGAGFLGSHLVDRLLLQGHAVTSIDNLYTGNTSNFQSHLNNPSFKFVLGDVTTEIKFSDKFDQIYNLACPASPVHYQKNPVETIKSSLFGSFNLLELATRIDARILQASTSEVYGDPVVSPQNEDYWGNVNPIGIRACYDEGKRASETMFFDFYRQFGLSIKVARIFNTYGPRMDLNDGRVVSNFMVQALKGLPITVYGDGTQTRSFCYVDDLISGLIALMNSPKEVTGPINIGNQNEFTMLELAKQIIYLTGSSSQVIFNSLPSDDPKQRKPDISKAFTFLNWKPKIELSEGLALTLLDFEKRVNSLT
jgi:UDP-glucuronate decarboxylase